MVGACFETGLSISFSSNGDVLRSKSCSNAARKGFVVNGLAGAVAGELGVGRPGELALGLRKGLFELG
jgi:hypothetical protein